MPLWNYSGLLKTNWIVPTLSTQVVSPVSCGTHLRWPFTNSQCFTQILGHLWCCKQSNKTKFLKKINLDLNHYLCWYGVFFGVCLLVWFFPFVFLNSSKRMSSTWQSDISATQGYLGKTRPGVILFLQNFPGNYRKTNIPNTFKCKKNICSSVKLNRCPQV